ncbi:hypothetical protein D3C76_1002340 [compost metagenome]
MGALGPARRRSLYVIAQNAAVGRFIGQCAKLGRRRGTGQVQQWFFTGAGCGAEAQGPGADKRLLDVVRPQVGAYDPDILGGTRITFQSVGNIDHGAERRCASRVRSDFFDADLSRSPCVRCFFESGKTDHEPRRSVHWVMPGPYCTLQCNCKCNGFASVPVFAASASGHRAC